MHRTPYPLPPSTLLHDPHSFINTPSHTNIRWPRQCESIDARTDKHVDDGASLLRHRRCISTALCQLKLHYFGPHHCPWCMVYLLRHQEWPVGTILGRQPCPMACGTAWTNVTYTEKYCESRCAIGYYMLLMNGIHTSNIFRLWGWYLGESWYSLGFGGVDKYNSYSDGIQLIHNTSHILKSETIHR